jgi:hypothetical protein
MQKFTLHNRQLLDGKQNRLAQLHIKAPKPQATTYRNRHRIPKLTQLGYIETGNRTTSN